MSFLGKYIGEKVKRTEDPRLVKGIGHYVDDIELAGTLLLVALVGAVAIASFGRPKLGDRIDEALQVTPAPQTKDGVIEGVPR